MNYQQHKAKLMEDPEFKAEYKALEAEYQCIREDIQDLKDAEEALTEYNKGGGIPFE